MYYLCVMDSWVVTEVVPIQIFRNMKRFYGRDPKHFLAEVPLAVCPLAQSTFATLDGTYMGHGRVRATYFTSSLLTSAYAATLPDGTVPYRTNAWGPYKPEEIDDTSNTIFMGDGVGFTDAGAIGYEVGQIDISPPTVWSVDASMYRRYSYDLVGNPWPCFGIIGTVIRYDAGLDTPYQPWDYYHPNPCASHFDGHVSKYSPSSNYDFSSLRKAMTREGTDQP